MSRKFIALFVFILPLAVAGADPDHGTSVVAAREARLKRLQAPEGWLSLVGLHWLREGAQSVGGQGADVAFKGADGIWGSVVLDSAGEVRFTAALDGLTAEGKPLIQGQAIVLNDDTQEAVAPVRVRRGTYSFHLVDRGGRKGLRVRNTETDTRVGFLGLDYFPIDPAWRVEARWVPFDEPRTVYIQNILGQKEKESVRGEAVFVWNGREVRLLAIWDGDPTEELFFVISDETSGEETYAAARFVYAKPPLDGRVVIDFNLAVNPPCAFTPFATCPLPPEQNQLKFRVTAGERRYRGELAHP